ncbi:hypothetical protein [Clostridium sp. BSD9I1]|uniref:hypothetical protein n=1 Tax=Clostridium sp. BSD9I1 TaxID=2003589 RepID=UPI001FA8C58B|nr:hypothetical protein [Clostridium sp. BSD9I1]
MLLRKELLREFIRENNLTTAREIQDALKDVFASTLYEMLEAELDEHLGYTKDENKHLVIVPEEAEIIKRIYREYLEGSSMDKIKKRT